MPENCCCDNSSKVSTVIQVWHIDLFIAIIAGWHMCNWTVAQLPKINSVCQGHPPTLYIRTSHHVLHSSVMYPAENCEPVPYWKLQKIRGHDVTPLQKWRKNWGTLQLCSVNNVEFLRCEILDVGIIQWMFMSLMPMCILIPCYIMLWFHIIAVPSQWTQLRLHVVRVIIFFVEIIIHWSSVLTKVWGTDEGMITEVTVYIITLAF
jgi:hypothetical protein